MRGISVSPSKIASNKRWDRTRNMIILKTSEYWETVRCYWQGKAALLEGNQFQFRFVHHKSHIERPVTNPGHRAWKTAKHFRHGDGLLRFIKNPFSLLFCFFEVQVWQHFNYTAWTVQPPPRQPAPRPLQCEVVAWYAKGVGRGVDR